MTAMVEGDLFHVARRRASTGAAVAGAVDRVPGDSADERAQRSPEGKPGGAANQFSPDAHPALPRCFLASRPVVHSWSRIAGMQTDPLAARRATHLALRVCYPLPMAGRGWQIWIDRGGTFTDVLAKPPRGPFRTHKLLSEDPAGTEDPTLAGIRAVTGLGPADDLRAAPIESVTLGTTVGTNALLERTGAATVFVTTQGFGDVLRIGTQNRPRLFAREIVLPEPLAAWVVEVSERVSADGEVLIPLDERAARSALAAARAEGATAAAIALVHGWRYPAHEARVAELAREAGYGHVSVSHETVPLQRLVPRGDTTVADAYLSPPLRAYVDRVAAGLGPEVRLRCMQSNGGLAAADRFRGKDSVFSGPAGGVVGAARISARAGHRRIIGFDMGGTSTDVCHVDGAFERTRSAEVAGVRLRAPMLSIHTVAAGGGSILRFDGARFRVGPESAGAVPGPACYRRGGPLTVTDANLLLGRIRPESFPAVFGPEGGAPLDPEVVRQGFADLAAEITSAAGNGRTPEEVAEGFLAVAVDNMAAAIKRVSVHRGHDVTRTALCCFGGAGGQHACAVADALGMDTVIIHPQSGILSAVGMGLADFTAIREQTVERPLTSRHLREVETTLQRLATAAAAELRAQGLEEKRISVALRVHVRTAGSDTALPVPFGAQGTMVRAFRRAHRRRFGFVPGMEEVLVAATAEAEATGKADVLRTPRLPKAAAAAANTARVEVHSGGTWRAATAVGRSDLKAGEPVMGPALVLEDHGTNWIAPGWQAELARNGSLVLTRAVPRPKREAAGTRVDPVRLEIFHSRFMSVAEHMGAVLKNTASSVNIKERLDFSCAVFDSSGGLVANAPHIPVHLGAMPETVRAVLEVSGAYMLPGDMYITNVPADGGTHLPDVTVLAPVFGGEGDELRFLVGARAHHADIGGITPGSMPAHSRALEEEGVSIPSQLLVRRGRFRETRVREVLGSGRWPARNPAQNIRDLKAQVAACQTGVGEVHRMIAQYGYDSVRAYMGHVQDNAAESVRRVLDRLPDGEFACALDDGSKVRAAIRVDRAARTATVDFTGTSPQRAGNFNAPPAIARAAVLYVFRCLIGDDIPLNSGCLEPLAIVLRPRSLVNPDPGRAVAAGNVETSQLIADALFGATGTLAASQGTMNNFSFGDARHQYYETLCGGAGAGPGFAGASAVHTHMTNSRLTDVEVLESRYPVVVESFAIRRGSGGGGAWRGGNGVVRRLRFTAPVRASLLSGRRVAAPHGLAGGEAGATGRGWIERAAGVREDLAGSAEIDLEPGDVLVIETPGGGGYGSVP